MVPGIITYYWLTPTRVGDFEVLCAEYCGSGHYAMRGRVIVEEEKDVKVDLGLTMISSHGSFLESQLSFIHFSFCVGAIFFLFA